jgi:hypothetical protein
MTIMPVVLHVFILLAENKLQVFANNVKGMDPLTSTGTDAVVISRQLQDDFM